MVGRMSDTKWNRQSNTIPIGFGILLLRCILNLGICFLRKLPKKTEACFLNFYNLQFCFQIKKEKERPFFGSVVLNHE